MKSAGIRRIARACVNARHGAEHAMSNHASVEFDARHRNRSEPQQRIAVEIGAHLGARRRASFCQRPTEWGIEPALKPSQLGEFTVARASSKSRHVQSEHTD